MTEMNQSYLKKQSKEESSENLAFLREKINQLDCTIVEALIQRCYMARQIGQYKLDHKLAILDERREKERLEFVLQFAKSSDSKEFYTHLHAIYEEILKQSKKIQEELLN